MNILVTGANGQLGNEMRVVGTHSADHYIFTDIEQLDITSVEAIESIFSKECIDIVVNCAAYTAVDRAEEEEDCAYRINHHAVANLAKACVKHGATLIHLSTDYIFDGNTDTPYTEEATPSPLNIYGKSKLAGEESIIESGCHHIIIRTAWLYSTFGNNFCKRMCEMTASQNKLRVVCDQIGSPTYAEDLAKAIAYIIESRQLAKCGIYNYSGEGECSWYDFAVEIARLCNHLDCNISPCRSEEYSARALRPRYSLLDKGKFCETFGIEIPDWRVSLAKCIRQLNRGE